MKKSQRIALIQGGLSGERDVSLATGAAFESALKKMGQDYFVIDAGADLPQVLGQNNPSVALLALHGRYAEDGVVQGICEYLKIPYSGSGVLSSALCMDKIVSKQIMVQNNIPTAAFIFFDSQLESKAQLKNTIGYPCVVKPSREGSSLGVSICKTESDFIPSVDEALKFDHQILIEEYIPGKEITVPILGGKALTPIEIQPKLEFYNYENKYTPGNSDYLLPADLAGDVLDRCMSIALNCHKVCRARTYSRVDFRVSPKGDPFVMEINTLPGCTPTSLLPKSAAYDGISFESLIQLLIDKATLDY